VQGGRRNRAQDKGTLLRAVEDWPRAIGSPCHFADEGDAIQPSESREMGFATRELLLTRVNHLSAALAQLDAGEYGRCGEYGETISPARLLAMPEVQCCVRCQDRLEHLGPRMDNPSRDSTSTSTSVSGARMTTWQTAQCPPLPRPTRAPVMDFGKTPL
jgi:RNA polymerase-binding transcription factor DksA